MGRLVVRRYPTKLFLKLADHTYVECGTGVKGWSCWGGKTGGSFLRDGLGSTKRANAIAEENERAGITCYLINGVCHQAANRILIPADITVDGALGYTLSISLFGLYGKPKGFLGKCKAPFNMHEGVSGDLPECVGSPDSIQQPLSFNTGRLDYNDDSYMRSVKSLYQRATLEEIVAPRNVREFHMEQFRLLITHKLGSPQERLTPSTLDALLTARETFEELRLEAEEEFAARGDALAFAAKFDALTLKFQDDAAEALEPSDYYAMFNLSPEERYLLADPDIVAAAYGPPPATPLGTGA